MSIMYFKPGNLNLDSGLLRCTKVFLQCGWVWIIKFVVGGLFCYALLFCVRYGYFPFSWICAYLVNIPTSHRTTNAPQHTHAHKQVEHSTFIHPRPLPRSHPHPHFHFVTLHHFPRFRRLPPPLSFPAICLQLPKMLDPPQTLL